MLVYLTKRCIHRVSTKQNKVDVFKSIQMNTISRFLNEKLSVNSLYEALEDCPNIAYINFIDNIIDQENIDVHEDKSLNDVLTEYFLDNNDTLVDKNILVVDSYYGNADTFDERLTFAHNLQFEITVICSTSTVNNNSNKFNADVFARHGNQHKSWWFQSRNDFLRRQLDENDCIASYLLPHQSYTLMFCRIDKPDVESLRGEYLSYLGGQRKCKCGDHKLSLIRSFEKLCKCNICNERYEYYRCPSIKCKSCICKNCFNLIENNNDDNTVLIDNHDSNSNNEELINNQELNEQIINDDMNEFYESDDDSSLQVPHPHATDDNGYLVVEEEQDYRNEDYDEIDLISDRVRRNDNNDGLLLSPDDFDDFVTSCNDNHDITNDDLDIISKTYGSLLILVNLLMKLKAMKMRRKV